MKKYTFLDLATVNRPYMDRLDAAATEVIHSGRYVGGEAVSGFEEKLAGLCQVPFAVGVSNGLDAIRLIFGAYIELGKLQRGDEVIVPANTYVASVLAITDMGLVPVFAEPDEHTHNLDTSRLEEFVTPRIKAVLVVHLYGRACYDHKLRSFVEKHNLLLIEDNAQAIDAEAAVPSPWNTVKTGSLGHAAAFSFYPTKNLGALGDAGAVSTHDEKLAKAVRALANYGSDRRYHNIYRGYNCRMDPIQAAFLSVKFEYLAAETERRRQLAAVYNGSIDNPLVVKPLVDNPDRAVWHQYVVRAKDRDAFRAYLAENGVETDIHYAVPPHLQPCYSQYASLHLPVTEMLAGEVVSLPVSSCTTFDDAREIAAIINNYRK